MIEQLYNTNLTRPNKLSTKINTNLSRTKISQKDQNIKLQLKHGGQKTEQNDQKLESNFCSSRKQIPYLNKNLKADQMILKNKYNIRPLEVHRLSISVQHEQRFSNLPRLHMQGSVT